MDNYTDIQAEFKGHTAIIRLNRPDKLNAFTHHTLSEIRQAVDEAVKNSNVTGIVITGNGRGFCSGLDSGSLAEVTHREPDSPEFDTPDNELPGIFSYLLSVPKPVITAINGVAAGGGLILALMSDIRIASDQASFITVFLRRGLIAEHGSSWILPRLVGTGRALDLLWASEKIDAETAIKLGLVDKLVESDQLLDYACQYVERLSETVPPKAMAETKRLVYRHLGVTYTEALHEANESQNRFVIAPDAVEGAKALLEKRSPVFSPLYDDKLPATQENLKNE